jgi:hypothetical protein
LRFCQHRPAHDELVLAALLFGHVQGHPDRPDDPVGFIHQRLDADLVRVGSQRVTK